MVAARMRHAFLKSRISSCRRGAYHTNQRHIAAKFHSGATAISSQIYRLNIAFMTLGMPVDSILDTARVIVRKTTAEVVTMAISTIVVPCVNLVHDSGVAALALLKVKVYELETKMTNNLYMQTVHILEYVFAS